MSLSGIEKLRRFYGCFTGDDSVLIVINADPDAIASAMAVKRLLWRKVATVAIANINVIKRPDNIAMVRLLGVDLIPFAKINAASWSRCVLIDSQPSHNESFAKLSYDVVIDHHPKTEMQAAFQDIRPTYGANASILTEYLKAAKIKPSIKLATGLFLGIKTDTNNFTRQTLIEDVRAFQYLFRFANMHLVRKIEQGDISKDFLKYITNALTTRRFRGNSVFVHLGAVPNPDVCVLIADFFNRVDTVNWSIVSGIYKKALIIIFRNDGIRKNAGNVAKTGFGSLGCAGGHKSMARAEVLISQLDNMVDVTHNRKVLNWIIGKVESAFGRRARTTKNT
jgi:nanoRNase/pAp phosphatase (c-di-AMP/oligoRNAs hydrolase)